MLRRSATILASALLLSGCASEGDLEALNSGRTNVVKVQEKFRESILDSYVDNAKQELVIAEAISPTDTNYQEAEVTPELKAWRDELSDDWKELKFNQLDLMCELFFQGLVDDESRFADILKSARDQLASQGTEVYSITNIRMREDNRKTIQFPTEKSSSSLFVCSSRIVLKLSIGDYTQPLDSTLAWNYYLSGGERKFTFTFKLKS
jgi:hypothetical protein